MGPGPAVMSGLTLPSAVTDRRWYHNATIERLDHADFDQHQTTTDRAQESIPFSTFSRSLRPLWPSGSRLLPRSLARSLARNQKCKIAGAFCDIGSAQLRFAVRNLIRHNAVIEKIPERPRLDRKVDVFWNIAGRAGKLQSVDLGRDHTDDLSPGIEQRATAVAGLNCGADLQDPGIVQQSAQGTHDTSGDRKVRG